MPRNVWLLLLAGCADPVAPVEPVPAPEPPVLRFVGFCPRPAIWWVIRDAPSSHAADIWLMTATDSVDLPPTGEPTLVTWAELDGYGFPIQQQTVGTDSLGVGRTTATCLGG